METRPVGVELFHAGRQKDRERERQDEGSSRISQFFERALKLTIKLFKDVDG
jgi:uncharacterized protein (DUF169 family)